MAVTGTNITLTTRTAKGSALTHAELDANQTGLKTAVESHSHDEFATALGTDDNYMADAEKTKLAGIAAGAEVNVQADWNASTGDAAILNKPEIPSINGLLNESAHDALDHSGLPGVPASYTLPVASATVLGGVKVDGTTVLISDGVISSTGGGGGGVTDHGLLTGLSDDDHSQYLNSTRHGATDHAGLTGVLAIGTTGTTACAGNDPRLSDSRTPTDHSHAQSDVTDLTTALAGKQAALVSGTNIKTINGASVLGSGDIEISGSGMTNPMTAAGDMIIGGTAGTPARLGKGTDGQVLTLAAGVPAWSAASVGGADYDEIIVSDSAVTSVTFSGLDGDADGGYVLSVSCKQALAGGLLRITCNGIATGDYHRQLLVSSGSAAVGVHDSDAPYCAYISPNTVTDTVVSFECAQNSFHILFNYAENVSPSYGFIVGQAYPQAQANLTSITLTNTQVGGIDVGSVFRLYPRK